MTDTRVGPNGLNSIPEALKRLPISRSTFYELLKSGEIKSVKIGARRFVADSQIDEFIRGLVEAA